MLLVILEPISRNAPIPTWFIILPSILNGAVNADAAALPAVAATSPIVEKADLNNPLTFELDDFAAGSMSDIILSPSTGSMFI